jgi:hypothetical protein
MTRSDSIVHDRRARGTSTAIVDDLAICASASAKNQPRICRAMTQQRSDFGQSSMPQKFVRLVGCHDPDAGRAGGR